jgi:hypothetical protein
MVDVEVSSRGAEPSYIALRVELEPLDQTNLKNSVDAILEGGGRSFWKLTSRGHHGRLARHHGGAGRPHLVASWGPPRCGVFWCPQKPSRVVFITVNFGFISHFDPPC